MIAMFGFGIVGAGVVGLGFGWTYAPMVGWDVAALCFVIWAWVAVGRLDPVETRAHATREDPSRGASEAIIILANLASLAAVALVIFRAAHVSDAARIWLGLLALFSVAISWVAVQTLFTLGYAREYYGDVPGGIDFNSDVPPTYADFAYLAFTMGMTYQVSDTNLQTSRFRVMVLRHALLSYLFGTVILATTINLVVGLSGQ
jgi:uncharacterized membrane protein